MQRKKNAAVQRFIKEDFTMSLFVHLDAKVNLRCSYLERMISEAKDVTKMVADAVVRQIQPSMGLVLKKITMKRVFTKFQKVTIMSS